MKGFAMAVGLALLVATIMLWVGLLGADYTTSFIQRWEASVGMRPMLIVPPPKSQKKTNKLTRIVRV